MKSYLRIFFFLFFIAIKKQIAWIVLSYNFFLLYEMALICAVTCMYIIYYIFGSRTKLQKCLLLQ